MLEESSHFWDWRFESRVHYRMAGTTGPAIVLVHGFGVASFQFESLIDHLSEVSLLLMKLSLAVCMPAPFDGPSICLEAT